MGISKAAKMRARANQPVGRMSEAEKEERLKRYEEKKSATPYWLIWAMGFILLGSTIFQFFSYKVLDS